MKLTRDQYNWPTFLRLIEENTTEIDEGVPKEPIVSVSLVTFNQCDFIEQAIQSVVEQSIDNMEIVIADDGSTDGTNDIIEHYQKQHPTRIRRLVAKQNLGRFTGNGRLNFLRSLLACNGKYVAFLEGDDYWTDPSKLEKQINALESNREFSASAHKTEVISNKDDYQSKTPWREYDYPESLELERVIARHSPFHTTSFLVRNSLMQNLPEMVLTVQSLDMCLFMLAAGSGPIHFLSEDMSVYRKHFAGVTSANNHRGASYHLNRIKLHEALRAHLNQCDSKFRETIQGHRSKVRSLMLRSLPFSRQSAFRKSVEMIGWLPTLQLFLGIKTS